MMESNGYFSEEQDDADRKAYYSQYSEIEDFSMEELSHLLTVTHSSWLPYHPSTYLYPEVDLHPDGKLRSIYSTQSFSLKELIAADRQIDLERAQQAEEWATRLMLPGEIAPERLLEEVESLLPYNCEHVVCQSWFKSAAPMRGDLHHLFVCESECNSFRNNSPYTDFPAYQPKAPYFIEKERYACGSAEEGLFEPENNKGIVARAVLYFQLRYPGLITVYGKEDMRLLSTWSNQQPVALYERHRNQEIFRVQGNRNPFIDFPALSSLLF